MAAPPPTPARLARVVAYFRRHPILLLLAFTPGIPEYLSGSTALWPIVLSPFGFLLFLGLNLGLYGPGVLLVREAHVRWKKGWSTILLLGGAYGLLEEGTALSTLFNPKASVVSSLGSYGHAYGVNWVWLLGILGVHIVYSVGLPILLLGLALPETRGQRLLTNRQLPLTAGIYLADIAFLAYITHYYAVAGPLLVLAAVVAGLLWLVAWQIPAGLLDPPRPRPERGPRYFLILGLVYFALLIVVPGLIEDLQFPAPVAFSADLATIVGTVPRHLEERRALRQRAGARDGRGRGDPAARGRGPHRPVVPPGRARPGRPRRPVLPRPVAALSSDARHGGPAARSPAAPHRAVGRLEPLGPSVPNSGRAVSRPAAGERASCTA